MVCFQRNYLSSHGRRSLLQNRREILQFNVRPRTPLRFIHSMFITSSTLATSRRKTCWLDSSSASSYFLSARRKSRALPEGKNDRYEVTWECDLFPRQLQPDPLIAEFPLEWELSEENNLNSVTRTICGLSMTRLRRSWGKCNGHEALLEMEIWERSLRRTETT